MKISVALAYHDGGKHVEEQLCSILNQLEEKDELILSVDRAFDGSIDLLKSWEKKDPRVFVTQAVSRGMVKNYEHAIAMCSGDLIFLSSQDDPWFSDKVSIVRRIFYDREVMAVVHDGIPLGAEGEKAQETLFQRKRPVAGYVRNLWNHSYRGCGIAFRKELTAAILPIPEQVTSHEYWIGGTAQIMGKLVFLDTPLFWYREDKTTWEQEPTKATVKRRLDMLAALLKRKRELENEKK